MSDLRLDEEPTEIVFRAALPGRPGGLVPPPDPDRAAMLFAPGRVALEAAVLLAALALLVPVCAPGAVACALAARRKGNRRGVAALVTAVWCGVLGVVIRWALGFGILL